MKIEKGIISNTQLVFLFIGYLQSSVFTAAYISDLMKQNTWVVTIIGFFIIFVLLLVYLRLSEKVPEKNLIQINDIAFGRYIGKFISLLYISYFAFIIPANLRYAADFFSSYLFPETDIKVFIVLLTLITMYTLRKGLEIVARIAPILAITTVIAAIWYTSLIIKDANIKNFLPPFQIRLKELVQGVNLMVSIPFGEMILFMMIFPYVNDRKMVKKYSLLGYSFGSLYFLVVILRNIAVLGNISSLYVLPSYQVARLVNVGEIITRTETFIAMTILFNEYLKSCVCYYATVLGMAQLFKMRSYKPLIPSVGLVSIILAVIMFDSPSEQAHFAANIYPVFVLPYIIILPVVSLILIQFKKYSETSK